MRRKLLATSVTAAAFALSVAVAAPAGAVPADKGQVLSNWTQTSAGSYDAWAAARANQGAWSAYAFNWSTDYCSSSPDNPFGFPFQMSCARHDFGYRNYKEAGAFDANKARVDSAFYADLKRVCSAYSGAKLASCNATAWTYYQAVDKFGFAPAA
ncbi:phospholipase [Streptomyces sp. NBC_01381]|uniref:phospholipase n=1 Tax=Streptomyces sp. NBC_01381 TaxID=2903845 RepID=UPI00225375E5|nr:phospholipase [Streptomyces sp. NBC_01381]MCX4672578.1 phospholipase [Streptomyces sp. NBC_01381]